MPIDQALASRSIVIVAAHPDDETVGAGGLLPMLRAPVVVTVTDGSPRDTGDAERAGCATREDYARLRRNELLGALEVAGLPSGRARPLNIVDQEASLEMTYVTLHLVALLRELRPAIVLTHPYEGGHPDNDATAFAVHAACARIPEPPDVYEFTSYHAHAGEGLDDCAMEVGKFLPESDDGEPLVLPDEARELKSRMIACFISQLPMLRRFPVDVERYRAAPVYDFTQAPHPGKLFYEHFNWGLTGERWRHLAEKALRTLRAGTSAP